VAVSQSRIRGFRLGLSKKQVEKSGGVFKFGQWDAVRKGFKGRARFNAAISEESQVFGEASARRLVRRIRAMIRGGGAEGDPLSVVTTERLKEGRTKDTPWHESGRLAESVEARRVGKFTWAVGFREGTGSHGKMSISAIAVQLEFGARIKVTEAMRAYLRAKGVYLNSNTRFIIIPPRPLVRPAIAHEQNVIAQDFFGSVGTRILNRVFGTPGRSRPRR
jgi:hypothetical protein